MRSSGGSAGDDTQHSANKLLAASKHCGYARSVRTLHLRNVPDDVMDRLERMARAASTSVTAVAIRELDAATRRVDNAALVATLPDLDIPTASIVEQLESERR
jgi:hypothetical protein